MDYEQFKKRRIELTPPLPLKEKIDLHAKGKRSEFILDAVREKIKQIEQRDRESNSVKRNLGS